MKVIKPNTNQEYDNHISVFLAGSIEMGKAVDWQVDIENKLAHIKDLVIFNPRRDDWDSSWKQSITDLQFNQQVNWELDKLEEADIIFLYFSPGTQSPISLLELGLFARSNKIIVCCPEGFWRKGNVEIVCDKFGILLYTDFNEAITKLIELITPIQ